MAAWDPDGVSTGDIQDLAAAIVAAINAQGPNTGGGGAATDVSALAKESGGNLAAILAKIPTAPALDSSLQSILTKLPSSPALDATVAAITTKLNAGVGVTSLPSLPAGTATIGSAVLRNSGGTEFGLKTGGAAPVTADAALVAVLHPSGDHARDATFAQSSVTNQSLAALNAAVTLAPGRKGTSVIQVTGTFVGTLTLQGSVDGTNYVSLNATPQFLNLNTGAYTATITAPGIYQTSMNGLVGAKITMTSFTSGTAVVSASLTDAPAMVALDASLPAGTNEIGRVRMLDGSANTAVIKTSGAAPVAADNALVVSLSPNSPLGAVPVTSLNAATTPASGTALDNIGTRKSHTLQVDITTTTAGTAGAHSINIQGSLDGTNYTSIGTVTPASTSTNAADASNHANVSIANVPYRYIRANWGAIPTSWVGTLTARVTSGV